MAPEVFFELDAAVISLFHEPDGLNINKECGSQHPERLAEEVVKRQASIGLAFDGDGDRVIVVNEEGAVLSGDQIIAICATAMQRRGRLKNNLVVTTVMSNLGLKVALAQSGITHVEANVGDRYVLEEMQAQDATLGGEDSGHIIFLEHHSTGDGIIAALELLRVMREQNKELSELGCMQVFPQKLINVTVKHKPEIASIPQIDAVIKGVERRLGDKGRVLVRYSGTQQMCRVMVEGPTEEDTESASMKIADVIRAHLA